MFGVFKLNFLYLISKIIKKSHLPAVKNTRIHPNSKICSGAQVVDSDIDRYTYIGNNCQVIMAKIGSFCSIADNCIIGGASHPVRWVSTSPVFHEGKNILHKNFATHEYNSFKKTKIGSDVWVGNNALIKSGVTIGNGAIVGMGSVVTKNVGPYEIWAGNPARLVKRRFTAEQIEILEQDKWWKKTDTEIKSNSALFTSVDEYIEELLNSAD